jgi:hypothetical protein
MIVLKFAHYAALGLAPFAGLCIYGAVMPAVAAAAPQDAANTHSAHSAGSHRNAANTHSSASGGPARDGVAGTPRRPSAEKPRASVVDSKATSAAATVPHSVAAATPAAGGPALPTLPGIDVRSALQGLRRELSNAAAELDASAALLQTRLNSKLQRLNQLAEQASADAKRRFERMEAIVRGGLENFESELEDLESGLEVGPEVDALENGVRALYAELEDLINRKSDIGKQLAIVEQKLNEELLRLHEYIRSTVAAATPL